MKRASVIFFGASLFAFIVALGLAIRWVIREGRLLDRITQEYADASIVAVVSNWNEQALLDRASPQLLAKIRRRNDLKELFAKWRRLGELVKYEGSIGQAHVSVGLTSGIVISALYLANAKFKRGTATIRIVLIKEGAGWRIFSFGLFGVPEASAPTEPRPARPGSHRAASPAPG